ncbi:hypothetical protein Y032_0002g1149 [Ancylostoma ceylanicum]|uniref:Peptidase M20 dimerisation domain-containing protein n=1 Tax=Ancylostoma ceylanicum TaxID=53326 RepID=A0A016VZ63_9BILA|nr:hypothetical protein Y032_0002g1149 [Ancylostoma ceylanicum]
MFLLFITRKIAVPGKPFIIMTIPGSQPKLPSIVLYSHTDVVPTFKDNWKYDPYSGYKDEHGNIYGRGAQDMKSVGSQYFEAIRRHFKRGKRQWLRTIHIVWAPGRSLQKSILNVWVVVCVRVCVSTPDYFVMISKFSLKTTVNLTHHSLNISDEEIGAIDGMAKFVKMPEFRELNLGFMLDEGLATEGSTYKVYYAERNPWWIEFTCEGSPGHGSKFIENTAGEKLVELLVLLFCCDCIVCSTGEDSWENAVEKKSAGNRTGIGEGAEKNRHCARILNYHRVWNRL